MGKEKPQPSTPAHGWLYATEDWLWGCYDTQHPLEKRGNGFWCENLLYFEFIEVFTINPVQWKE